MWLETGTHAPQCTGDPRGLLPAPMAGGLCPLVTPLAQHPPAFGDHASVCPPAPCSPSVAHQEGGGGGGGVPSAAVAGRGCDRVSQPVPPPPRCQGAFFSRELLNNLHPPRRSFWALFVKVNLQLAASGESNMIAAWSLSHMPGGCSGTAPLAGTAPHGQPRAPSRSQAGAGDPAHPSPHCSQLQHCRFLGPGMERATSLWLPWG